MTDYVGGLRQRLISDSVYQLIKGNLTLLGWFNPGRRHRPITIRTEAVGNNEEIPINTIVVNETVTTDDEAELGSNLGDIATTFYVDFYAENDAVGKELIHDVRDILKGRMTDIGRTRSDIPVYDWDKATPAWIFSCDVEDVVVDQARDFPKPYQRYWWVCRFDVVDSYDG